MKTKFLVLSALCASVMLTGCAGSMKASEIRTRLDACSTAQLDNIVYMRSDKSVLNVVCTPKESEINYPVTVNHPFLFALSPSHKKPALPGLIQ